MTGKILCTLTLGIVTLVFMQAPVFAHHRKGHKNGPPAHALHHYKHAKRHHKHGKGHRKHNEHHHDHGNHNGHDKHEGHDHHYSDGSSGVNVNLPADPMTLKPEVCIKGLCLGTK